MIIKYARRYGKSKFCLSFTNAYNCVPLFHKELLINLLYFFVPQSFILTRLKYALALI
jgi:hypothetical protein